VACDGDSGIIKTRRRLESYQNSAMLGRCRAEGKSDDEERVVGVE
jgi:hypothetical protein